MAKFMPGLELARLYYTEAVRPILQTCYPDLTHSAGLIGSGSEVLGFDSPMSADHNWGPRVLIFLSEEEHARLAGELQATLGSRLPFSFRGHPTHFEEVVGEAGTVLPVVTEQRPIAHRVQVTTLQGFVRRYTRIEIDQELAPLDWLTIPEQRLRTLVAGAVYRAWSCMSRSKATARCSSNASRITCAAPGDTRCPASRPSAVNSKPCCCCGPLACRHWRCSISGSGKSTATVRRS